MQHRCNCPSHLAAMSLKFRTRCPFNAARRVPVISHAPSKRRAPPVGRASDLVTVTLVC